MEKLICKVSDFSWIRQQYSQNKSQNVFLPSTALRQYYRCLKYTYVKDFSQAIARSTAEVITNRSNSQENVKSGKGPLTPAGILKFVKRFEETGKLEDRARAGRPCLKEARVTFIAVKIEAIGSEAASGTNSAREAARRLGLPPSSVRNILRRILQLYPYKLQSCHELCQQIPHRGKHLRSGPSKMEQDISRFMVTLTTITVPFGRPLIHVGTHRSHCIPQKGQHGVEFHGFIYHRTFFETQCPVNGWITEVTFGEDRIVSRRWRYPWPPRFPDLTPADFSGCEGYLKSRVYLSGPSSLSELKDAIRREVSSIHPDVLHSAVAGFVTVWKVFSLWWWSCGVIKL
ncbi:DUF4817 domain-containing protein [Trichonephila clavipes]|nr:DUF4817 domain-containing protein [Trichonephila clavipes]